jgi:hypothetical protein
LEERADERCEYCQAPQSVCGYRFHLEHIVPVAQGGSDDVMNRALACASCNLAKGDRVAGVDPDTGATLPLYHPRSQVWREHFAWEDDQQTLLGLTATGRVTIVTLDMNSDLRRAARQLWFTLGLLPQA